MRKGAEHNRLIRRVFGDETGVGKYPLVNQAIEGYMAVVVVTYVLLTIAPSVTLISATPLSKIRMLLGLLGAALLAVDAVTNRGLWRGTSCVLLYGICGAAAIASLLHISYGVKDNLFDLCWVAIQFGLGYSLAFRLSKEEMKRFVSRVFTITFLIWFIACCVSLYQFAKQIGYRYYVNPNSDSPELCRQGFLQHRLFGVFTGLDYAAYISLAHLVIGIHYVITEKRPFLRGLIGIMLVPVFLYLVLCGSRSVQISLFLYAFVLAWLVVRNWIASRGVKALLVQLMAGLCALIVCVGCYYGIKKLAPILPAFCNQISQSDPNDQQDELIGPELDEGLLIRPEVQGDVSNERFKIWRDYLRLSGEYGVFGLSLSNYNDYIADQHPDYYIVQYFLNRFGQVEKTDLVYECHNNYLFVLVSTGWLGLTLFVLFLVLTIIRLLRFVIPRKQLPLEFITALAITGIGCVQAMFMNSVFLKINAPSFLFWIALGIVNAIITQKESQ